MRFKGIIFSIILAAFGLAGPATAADLPPSATASEDWTPKVPGSGLLAQGALAETHSLAVKRLGDADMPAEAGVALYKSIAEELAASHDIPQAAEAYMTLVHELAFFSVQRGRELAPPEILDGAAVIARAPEDKAVVHFLTGWYLAGSEQAQQRARAGAEFSQALPLRDAGLKDQVLLRYADWAYKDGQAKVLEDGNVETSPDFAKALGLYSELASASASPELVAHAQARSEEICKPLLEIDINSEFRTGSQAQFSATWRNCNSVDIALYPIDMGKQPIAVSSLDAETLADAIVIPDDLQPARRLSLITQPDRPYNMVSETVRLDDMLMPGAYLAVASSGGLTTRDLLFITDNILTVKVGRNHVLAFTCNAGSGKPVAKANVVLWIRQNRVWQRTEKTADENGVAIFDRSKLPEITDMAACDIIAVSNRDQQQALSVYNAGDTGTDSAQGTVSAFLTTDASRYGKSASVRMLALISGNSEDSGESQPQVTFEISGPDGFTPERRSVRPDGDGVATADCDLPENAPEGSYTVRLTSGTDGREIGNQSGFEVIHFAHSSNTVSIRMEDRERDGYRVGETAHGIITLSSAYGGPIAGEMVDIHVDERNCDLSETTIHYGPWREFLSSRYRTNAHGEARFSVQTSASNLNDFNYRVRVDAVDQDGNRATATTEYFATRHELYAQLSGRNILFEQDQPVEVSVKTLSSNGDPVSASGTLRLLRESWTEVWVDRRGHEISGDEMAELRRHNGGWFNFGQSAGDYLPKTRGYTTETVEEIPLATGPDGTASYTWDHARPGYYRFIWMTDGRRGTIVSNERPFWVSGQGSVPGYKPSRIQVLTNPVESPAETDGSALAMVTVPSTDQNVLLMRCDCDIRTWSVEDMGGMARMFKTAAGAGEPGMFVEVSSVNDEKVSSARASIETAQSGGLSLSVSGNDRSYKPGQTVSLSISVKDMTGTPVKNARICLWVSEMDDSGALYLDTFTKNDILPVSSPRCGIRESSSIRFKPFFRPADTQQADAATPSSPLPETTFDEDPGMTFHKRFPTSNTQVWLQDLHSDDNGNATANFAMPDRHGRWLITVTAFSQGTGACILAQDAVTTEPFALTLNMPDQACVGDLVRVRASVLNNSPAPRPLATELKAAGIPLNRNESGPADSRPIPPGHSSYNELELGFSRHGTVNVEAMVKGADGISASSSIQVHDIPGMENSVSRLVGENGCSVSMPMPQNSGSIEWTASASPSRIALAGMPALLNDPSNGSTEAAGRIASVLSMRRLFRGMSYQPQAIDKAMEDAGAEDYASARMEKDIQVLLDTQNANGGWGWIDRNKPSRFATAYNLLMLNLCDGDTAKRLSGCLSSARNYAAAELLDEDTPADLQVLLLFGLASRELGQTRPTRLEAKALVSLLKVRDRLSPFALACLTLSAKQYGFDDEAASLARLIIEEAETDSDEHECRTVHWSESSAFDQADASEVESTAMSMLALVATGHAHEPVVVQAMRFIFEHGNGVGWDGPRESALCILALRDYAAYTGETDLNAVCRISCNGHVLGEYNTSDDGTLALPPVQTETMTDAGGKPGVDLQIERLSGNSPIFFRMAAAPENEVQIVASSKLDGVTISREFVGTAQVPTLLNGTDELVAPIEKGASLRVGERLNIIARIHTAIPLPLLMFQQPRPPFTSRHTQSIPVDIRNEDSGSQFTGKIDSGDDNVTLMIENLPAGNWVIEYPVRVDFAGEYTIQPARVWIPQRPSDEARSNSIRVKCVQENSSGHPEKTPAPDVARLGRPQL